MCDNLGQSFSFTCPLLLFLSHTSPNKRRLRQLSWSKQNQIAQNNWFNLHQEVNLLRQTSECFWSQRLVSFSEFHLIPETKRPCRNTMIWVLVCEIFYTSSVQQLLRPHWGVCLCQRQTERCFVKVQGASTVPWYNGLLVTCQFTFSITVITSISKLWEFLKLLYIR